MYDGVEIWNFLTEMIVIVTRVRECFWPVQNLKQNWETIVMEMR